MRQSKSCVYNFSTPYLSISDIHAFGSLCPLIMNLALDRWFRADTIDGPLRREAMLMKSFSRPWSIAVPSFSYIDYACHPPPLFLDRSYPTLYSSPTAATKFSFSHAFMYITQIFTITPSFFENLPSRPRNYFQVERFKQ
jgi:hypothetical protein